jgi:signal transduction histidine kinase
VVVWDDGPGLPGDRPVREGVGLSNTRARLEQIYGPDHRFELQNAPDGGMEARLEIPFERQPREAIRGAA